MKTRKMTALCAVLLFAVCLTGCFNVHIDLPELRTTAAAPTQDAGYVYDTTAAEQVPQTVLPADTPATAAVPDTPASEMPTAAEPVTEASKTPDAMTQTELLRFFNASLNRIKSENVGFTKSKLTNVLDLQLSNSAANTVVGLVKNSLLSETAEEKTVQKGSSGNDVFSPTGKSYISNLTLDDLTSISCTKNGDQYIIKLAVKGETNPTEGSIMSRGFDYITVDDVVNIYAPKVGATVARDDIQVVFSDCTATLTVNADGIVSAYETYVKGVMNMYNGSIKKVITINTDVAVTLASTTKYTGFVY